MEFLKFLILGASKIAIHLHSTLFFMCFDIILPEHEPFLKVFFNYLSKNASFHATASFRITSNVAQVAT